MGKTSLEIVYKPNQHSLKTRRRLNYHRRINRPDKAQYQVPTEAVWKEEVPNSNPESQLKIMLLDNLTYQPFMIQLNETMWDSPFLNHVLEILSYQKFILNKWCSWVRMRETNETKTFHKSRKQILNIIEEMHRGR